MRVPLMTTLLLLGLTASHLHTGVEANISNPCGGTGMGPYDYSQALCMSMVFYEAQGSGYLPSNRRVTWRWDSATSDGSDVGRDLTGGYYDAGDHVKFGFPMAFSATMLAWGVIDYEAGYSKAGQLDYGRAAIKFATDYFLKAHTNYFELYGQVGDGDADHAYWGRPEEMTMYRPSFKIDSNAPGSDLAGETAAALAAASIVFNNVDGSYASNLLGVAKELYDFADQKRGIYSDSIPQAANFYRSWSGYGDELAWAALWLNRATGDANYLTKARAHWDEFNLGAGAEQFGWDDKRAGVYALFSSLSGDQLYKNTLQTFMDHTINDHPYTPGGMVFLDQWGANRHAANVAFIAFRAADLGINSQSYRDWGNKQIDCLLGSTGRSFVVGFGNNPPQMPHHRSSSCPDSPAACDWNSNSQPGPNPQTLYGALVGGPGQDGSYTDDRNDYVHNEVACDYNAAFTGALAYLTTTH